MKTAVAIIAFLLFMAIRPTPAQAQAVVIIGGGTATEWKLTISSRGERFLQQLDSTTGERNHQGLIFFADIPKVEQALKKLKKCVREK